MLIGMIVATIAAVLDQISKALVFGYMSEQSNIVEIAPFFNLVIAWNTGVSFSMFNNLGNAGVYILSGFALIVAIFLLCWLKNEKSRYMQIALGLVIGGAIGNVIDRIRLGAVYDFLDIHINTYHWPAFNLADSFICIGAMMIICDSLLNSKCTKSPNFNEGLDK